MGRRWPLAEVLPRKWLCVDGFSQGPLCPWWGWGRGRLQAVLVSVRSSPYSKHWGKGVLIPRHALLPIPRPSLVSYSLAEKKQKNKKNPKVGRRGSHNTLASTSVAFPWPVKPAVQTRGPRREIKHLSQPIPLLATKGSHPLSNLVQTP